MDDNLQDIGKSRFSRRAVLGAGAAAGLAAAGVALPIGTEGYAAAATTLGLGLGPGGTLLKPDSRPYPNMPEGTDTIPEIEHIVVIMMENHSFDDHLGMLGRGDGLTLGADGKPINYNPDGTGGYVQSFHNPNTCGEANSGISQSWDTSHKCWTKGTNMGFAEACSGAAMGYWTGDDLPFYYSMASKFPIGDRYFCSVMAQTYPNRRFLISGTALGDISTGAVGIDPKDAPNGTIFDRLSANNVSWKVYYPDFPTLLLYEADFKKLEKQCVPVHEFFTDAAAGNLPSFSLIDPYIDYSEESNDISIGEAYAALMIEAVLKSPNWKSTALIWVYDEHGGWYDHVAPVPMVKPDNVAPDLEAGDYPGAYDYSGFRVPCCVVSPWAKTDYVSHQVFDHTSILKLLETKWNLPACTYRDANARNMLDFFDFKHPDGGPFAEAPTLAKPKNPFASTKAMPDFSLDNAAAFHPISQNLPAGSLPMASAKLTAPPTNAKALLAAQQVTIAAEAKAQTAALSGATTKSGGGKTTHKTSPARPLAAASGGSDVGLIGGVAAGALVLGGAALALRRRGSGSGAGAGGSGDPADKTQDGSAA